MKFVLEMANMLQIVLAQSAKGYSAKGTPKPVKILGRERRCQCPRCLQTLITFFFHIEANATKLNDVS